MKSHPISRTKATLGTGLSFAVAGTSLFSLTPALATSGCTSPSEIVSGSGVFEVVCDTDGDSWTPPENVTALEALLIGGGADGAFESGAELAGSGGQVVFLTNLDKSAEIEFNTGGFSVLRQGGSSVGYAWFGDDANSSGTESRPYGADFANGAAAIEVASYESVSPHSTGAGTGGADGSGVVPSEAGLGNSALWPTLENEKEYGVGGSATSNDNYGAGGFGNGAEQSGEPGAVIFRYTLGASTPAPYTGPIITDIGEDNIAAPYQTFGGQTVRVDGDRLSSVTKVFIDGKEGTVVSTADDHFVMISPEGLTPGTYDLVVQSSIGNLTYLDGFIVTEASANFSAANAICEGVEPSWWTQRISDTQAKAYIKCPAVGEKYRILQQTGGSGEYTSIFAKTLTDENDTTQVFNEFGRYIVRTIDLEDINRIRIRVDDEELWKVRYNNPPTGVVTY